MLTKKRYSVKDMVLWTRGETLIYLFYAGIITILYKVFGFTSLNVPWTPVALIGTAVAFLVGFQNQSAYVFHLDKLGNIKSNFLADLIAVEGTL